MTRSRPPRPRSKRAAGPSFLGRRWGWVLAGLFLVALVWRLAYVSRLSATPLAGTLRADERVYWDWATFLADHGLRGTIRSFSGRSTPTFSLSCA